LEVTTAKYLNDTPFASGKQEGKKERKARVGQFIPGEARGGDWVSE
jgi:hypothetical protein